MQGHQDVTMVHATTYILSTMANAIPCFQFQKNIQILWEPTSFVCLSNCEYLNSINVNFLQVLFTTILNGKYQHVKAQKDSLEFFRRNNWQIIK